MPLTAINEPAEVDAFGVRFTMNDRGERIRCHVFRSAINAPELNRAASDEDLLARFERNRRMFERLASNLFDAGHKTPWIEPFIVPG